MMYHLTPPQMVSLEAYDLRKYQTRERLTSVSHEPMSCEKKDS